MATNKQLTGGSGDVNPQTMTAGLTIGSNSNSVCQIQEVALPVQRLNNRNRSMVMEILKIQTYSTATGDYHFRMGLATSRPSSAAGVEPQMSDPNIFFIDRQWGSELTKQGSHWYDLTDGAGHGVLVGADKLYLFCYTTSTAASVLQCRIYYRWKNVSLTEYIGIVQAAQA